MIHSVYTKMLNSIQVNQDCYHEELSKRYMSLVLDITVATKDVATHLKDMLVTPKEGIYKNGVCVLPLGDTLYWLQNKPVTVPSAKEYLDKPIVLFDKFGNPFPFTVEVKRIHTATGGNTAKIFEECGITPFLPIEHAANLYLRACISERISLNNLGQKEYFTIDGCTTVKTNTDNSNLYVNPDYVSYANSSIETNIPSVDKVYKSIENFMFRNEWRSARIGNSEEPHISPIVRIESCGDQRILQYHIKQIEDIHEMQQKIEQGLIEDSSIIEQYRLL